MDKKSIVTSIESEQQVDGVWKTVGSVKIYERENEVGKEISYQVMSFDDKYVESVAVVSFAIYKFMSEDVNKPELWKVIEEPAHE